MYEGVTLDQNGFVLESKSPDKKWACIFEDNGETGYMYLGVLDSNGEIKKIVNHLRIYNRIKPLQIQIRNVHITWSKDSKRLCLMIDGDCWGIIDLKSRRKMNAKREGDQLVPLEMEIWKNGIGENEGEELEDLIAY